jgi:small neutral amino acid transporter SnatA (MarC family)
MRPKPSGLFVKTINLMNQNTNPAERSMNWSASMMAGWVLSFFLLWGAGAIAETHGESIMRYVITLWAMVSSFGLLYASNLLIKAFISKIGRKQVWCALGVNILSWLFCLFVGLLFIGTFYGGS